MRKPFVTPNRHRVRIRVPVKFGPIALTVIAFLLVALRGHATCLTPLPGLVAWWPWDGHSKDMVGGNPGVLGPTTSFSPGRVGMGLQFQSSGSIVSNAAPSLTGIQDSFTLEFWVLPTASRTVTPQSTSGVVGTRNQRYAIAPEHGGTSGPAGVGVSVGINGISVFEHAADHMPSPLVHEMAIRDWTHVAVVYTAKHPRLFVNGVLVKEGLTSARTSVFPSKTFGNITSYGQFLGHLDEVAIYERPLSSAEVFAIYEAGRDGKCRPHGPTRAVYREDFEETVGPEWSSTRRERTPLNGRGILGQFGNDIVTLTLTNLPTHSRLSAEIEWCILRTWDGNNGGPDVWQIDVVGGPVLLRSTFQSAASRLQTYPENHPNGYHLAKTGAVERDTLGYGNDAVYRRSFTFAHTGDSVVLRFQGSGLQGLSDESWAIESVVIHADGPQVDLSTGGSEFVSGTPIVLNAVLDPGTEPIEHAEFYHNGILIGALWQAPYSLVWSNPPAGEQVVTVRAVDAAGRVAEDLAVVRLNGLLAEYVAGSEFTARSVRRQDVAIGFDWQGKSPVDGVPGINFSARWTGGIEPEFTDVYTFYLSGDDRFRLWVDGKRIIDDWTGGDTHTRQGTIALQAGIRVPIQVDFYQGPGGADLRLEWSSARRSRQLVPPRRLFPPSSTDNRPPNAPIIVFPPADHWALDPGEPATWRADFFSDPDSGQRQAAAEWEICQFEPSERIWRAESGAGGGGFLARGLGEGAFEGSHASFHRLQRGRDYLLRVRHRDDSGLVNGWGVWAERRFNTTGRTLVSSTFDTDLEGWTYSKSNPNLRPGLTWMSAGYPGGCLFVDEYGNGDDDTTWLRAPAKFRGNQSAAIGGTLTFDMRISIPSRRPNHERIRLYGASDFLVCRPETEPGTDWTRFAVPLIPERWSLQSMVGRAPSSEEFREILSNITDVLVLGEYIDVASYSDNCYLDNVRLAAPLADERGPSLWIRRIDTREVLLEWESSGVEPILEWSEQPVGGIWSPVSSWNERLADGGRTSVRLGLQPGTRLYRLRIP